VENGEVALKYLDSLALEKENKEAKILAMFAIDDERTESLPKYPLTSGYFSYKRVFKWVFVAMSIVGAIGVIICLKAGLKCV